MKENETIAELVESKTLMEASQSIAPDSRTFAMAVWQDDGFSCVMNGNPEALLMMVDELRNHILECIPKH